MIPFLRNLAAPSTERRGDRPLAFLAAGLLAASAGIHLDLYLTGYSSIPTIGWLFLAQVASALAIAMVLVVWPRPLAGATAALFAASVLGGYLISRATTLFGFHELPTTAGTVAGALELAALACGALMVVRPGLAPARPQLPARPLGGLAGAVLMAGAVLLGVAASGTAPGVVAASAASSASTGPSATASATSTAATMKVKISNFAFFPAHFKVKPGEKILVTNDDSVAHTFSAAPNSSPQGHFATAPIQPGKSVSLHAPAKAGRFAFYCSIHPFMTGVMTVS
ncbi:MAG: blue (type 1) copper domain protein [Acidimicrobiaceae bacterium]|nr:blue (type 1) copper domain protein [Acidimicrobiaceae bacterium]